MERNSREDDRDMRVAIVGKAHSGKTSLGKALTERHNFQRIAFADPVKDVSALMLQTFCAFFGDTVYFTRQEIDAMKGHPAIRGLLQLVGTELGRDWHGPDTLWIDLFEKKVAHTEGSIVNDDCRFPNEVERLKKMGFTVIRLVRDEDKRFNSVFDATKAKRPDLHDDAIYDFVQHMLQHPSETQSDSLHADVDIASHNIPQLEIKLTEELTAYGPEMCVNYYKSSAPSLRMTIHDYVQMNKAREDSVREEQPTIST